MAAYFGLLLIGVFAFAVLWAEGTFRQKTALFVSAGLILLAMVLRGLCMDYETLDYQNFLAKWVQILREQGGLKGLRWSIGNYNIPYLFFLALFTYSDIPDLYLIKLLSVFFDVILAWGVMRLVYCFTNKTGKVLGAFFVTLFLPTVLLNGAYWGQCDSIYGAFAVWSVYFALKDKPILSVISVALSFAFKLQAVFIMPVFLIFIFAKKIRWWHLIFFPITVFLTMLPAIAAGRSVTSCVLLYFNQAGTVGSALNYNSSSVFAFLTSGADMEKLAMFGIDAAFIFLFILYFYCFIFKRKLDRRALLTCSLLIVTAVPFLLPHMHDRYFFIADVLSVALAFTAPALLHVPVLTSFASLLGYHAYLRMRYLLPMRYGAAGLVIVLITLIIYLSVLFSGGGKKSGHSSQS